jgi:hypothetical protein
MKGVYQHYAEKQLHRYLSEFDFRYSNRPRTIRACLLGDLPAIAAAWVRLRI